jgi:proteasome-associated ATPase
MKDQNMDSRFSERRMGMILDSFTKRAEHFLRGSDSEQSDEGKKLIERYQAVLQKVMSPPLYIGTVIGPVKGDEIGNLLIVNCNNRLIIVARPENESLSPGDTVMISSKTMQIVEKIDELALGQISIVKEVISSDMSEVDLNGDRQLVLNGQFSGKVQVNDRVILDASSSVIIGWLGNSQKRFHLGSKPTITWDDICGQKKAKEQLIEAIEMPIRHADLYRHYNKKPIKGAVIFGPPGCGKTMLLEAVATAVARLHGQDAIDSGFINIKGAEILDMYVGVAEGMVRQIFASARAHRKKYGYPAVIAIDEAEALLRRRGSGKSSDVETTIVPAFLTEMQGIDDSDAIVLLCTNRVDLLDPAVVRDGRIDRNIEVTRPDSEGAQAIFGLNLKKVPIIEGSLEEMVVFAKDEFFSPRYKFYDVGRNSGNAMAFTLAHLVSGAMLAGVIDKATSFSMRRDIEAGTKTGLRREDIHMAVHQTYEQKFNLDHSDELKEFVRDFSDELSPGSIQKVCQVVKP